MRTAKRLLAVKKVRPGYCPICEQLTIFIATSSWLRDGYLCIRCRSIPRFRALIQVLDGSFPLWRDYKILESSPSGASSRKLARECTQYLGTHFMADAAPGSNVGGYRSENLECLTFTDATFDLIVTQDVMEHVLHPDKAFREISRVLKPGGAHIFTVPWFHGQPTRIRARENDGRIEHLLPADYHANPVDERGALVVTEWGDDLPEFILKESGLITTPIRMHDPWRGIEADFLEVFVSRKAAPVAATQLATQAFEGA